MAALLGSETGNVELKTTITRHMEAHLVCVHFLDIELFSSSRDGTRYISRLGERSKPEHRGGSGCNFNTTNYVGLDSSAQLYSIGSRPSATPPFGA